MRRERVRQTLLPMGGNELWDRLPGPSRNKCRELLSRLLLAVVTAEARGEEADDEREDTTAAS